MSAGDLRIDLSATWPRLSYDELMRRAPRRALGGAAVRPDTTLWTDDPHVAAAMWTGSAGSTCPAHFASRSPALEGFGDGLREAGLHPPSSRHGRLESCPGRPQSDVRGRGGLLDCVSSIDDPAAVARDRRRPRPLETLDRRRPSPERPRSRSRSWPMPGRGSRPSSRAADRSAPRASSSRRSPTRRRASTRSPTTTSCASGSSTRRTLAAGTRR